MTDPSNENTVLAELVSYLDGELSDQAREQVERRMAVDEDYRQQLLELQKSWDLLDDLPRAPVSDEFAHSTVEMVALRATKEVTVLEQESNKKLSLWRYLAVGGIVAGFLVGYLTISSLANRGNERLVRDLPIIENVDVYDYVESVDFLSELEQSGLFSEEESDDSL